MTTALWLRNLGAFAVQAGVLVLGAALLARLFHIRAPRASLAYWRALLVVCLLLPFCQPWHLVTAPPGQPVVVATIADEPIAVGNDSHAESPSRAPISPEAAVLIVLVGGLAARGVWLLMGAWTLGRIRREATPLEPLPEAIAQAQARVGVNAAMFVSSRIAGPITFGLRRPIVVFPPGVTAMERSVQHAIACHELLHVRRRDWIFQILEEGVRSLLWFHPAVWWLVGRIQLSREQVVDQAAVALIQSRERYVEALLAVAIAKSPGILTPAPAFLRRSLLKKRVAQILQESTMTTRRLILAMSASAGVLALAALLAIRSFPLEAQGRPQAASGQPVEIVKGGEHLLHGELPEYPKRAIEQRVEGEVTVDLAVNDQGEVSDARVLNGPDELRKAALESVLSWHYAPSSIRSASTQATLRFNLTSANAEYRGVAYTAWKVEPDKGELSPAQNTERMIAELEAALRDPKVTGSQRDEYQQKLIAVRQDMEKIRAGQRRVYASGEAVEREKSESSTGPLRLVAFYTERVSQDAASEVLKRTGLKIGDPMTETAMKNFRAAATAVDEHFQVTMRTDGRGGASIVLVSRE
jgi:bla regulator protein BlaR1